MWNRLYVYIVEHRLPLIAAATCAAASIISFSCGYLSARTSLHSPIIISQCEPHV